MASRRARSLSSKKNPAEFSHSNQRNVPLAFFKVHLQIFLTFTEAYHKILVKRNRSCRGVLREIQGWK